MRDKRFIAQHRGGSLNKQQHIQLMQWAIECAEHALPLTHKTGKKNNARLIQALGVARLWIQGKASVGVARKASLDAHALAREASNPALIAVARSVGHTVATAHMADHSLGAAWYALKAVKSHAEREGKSVDKTVDDERKWQNSRLPSGIRELVLTARSSKKI